jgi:phage baseplate assembly protein W
MVEFKTRDDLIKNYAYDVSKNITDEGEVIDSDAINQSLENILLTNFGERVFMPSFGSNLLAMLFEAGTAERLTTIYSDLLDQIQRWENRVTVSKAASSLYFDGANNTVYIKIDYSIRKTGLNGSLRKKITL